MRPAAQLFALSLLRLAARPAWVRFFCIRPWGYFHSSRVEGDSRSSRAPKNKARRYPKMHGLLGPGSMWQLRQCVHTLRNHSSQFPMGPLVGSSGDLCRIGRGPPRGRSRTTSGRRYAPRSVYERCIVTFEYSLVLRLIATALSA